LPNLIEIESAEDKRKKVNANKNGLQQIKFDNLLKPLTQPQA
jgi:hypothetical protein